jgi:hypothetical protein
MVKSLVAFNIPLNKLNMPNIYIENIDMQLLLLAEKNDSGDTI